MGFWGEVGVAGRWRLFSALSPRSRGVVAARAGGIIVAEEGLGFGKREAEQLLLASANF